MAPSRCAQYTDWNLSHPLGKSCVAFLLLGYLTHDLSNRERTSGQLQIR